MSSGLIPCQNVQQGPNEAKALQCSPAHDEQRLGYPHEALPILNRPLESIRIHHSGKRVMRYQQGRSGKLAHDTLAKIPHGEGLSIEDDSLRSRNSSLVSQSR